jgi:hypothetical protein
VGAIDDHGAAVAHKLAIEPGDAAGLAWEAEVLAEIRHPGVVALLGADDRRLTTAYVGAHSLATWAPGTIDAIAMLAASLAATVADLHALGIVHGRIEPSHVLLGSGGPPVLCGFSGAVRRGQFVDPNGSTPEPPVDVHDLGALVSFLLRGGDRRRPLTGRRRLLHPMRLARDILRRRALTRLAERATAADPRHRPTARALAAAFHELAPADRAVERAPGARRRTPALATIGATTFGLGVLGWLAMGLARDGSGRLPRIASGPTTTVDPPRAAVPAPADVTIVGTNVIVTPSGRFDVGVDGDQAVVGDWDCDGVVTVALLRPSTGEVFVFDSWGDITVRPAARVPGATRAVSHDADGDGCAVIRVERANGPSVEVSG